jgi:hypothetical protein
MTINRLLEYRQISFVWIHVSMNNDIVVPMDAKEDVLTVLLVLLMERRPDVRDKRVEPVPNDHDDHDPSVV